MTTIWTYVLLVVGFVLLIKGADFFVEGSSGIAKEIKGAIVDYRTYDSGNGNIPAGMCRQCGSIYFRKQCPGSQ